MDAEGNIVSLPEDVFKASIIGVDKNVDMFDDFTQAEASSFINILAAQEKGIAIGDNHRLRPKDTCTRAEALTFIRRLHDFYFLKTAE